MAGKENIALTRSLVFVEDTAFGEELMEKLNKAGYTNFSKFFQGDEDWNLNQFATGNLDYLVSCHRISEGIDIQTVKQVVLLVLQLLVWRPFNASEEPCVEVKTEKEQRL